MSRISHKSWWVVGLVASLAIVVGRRAGGNSRAARRLSPGTKQDLRDLRARLDLRAHLDRKALLGLRANRAHPVRSVLRAMKS
jgi:hypothetical protein